MEAPGIYQGLLGGLQAVVSDPPNRFRFGKLAMNTILLGHGWAGKQVI